MRRPRGAPREAPACLPRAGWVPPSFDYRSLSPTKGRVNGMATSAVEHQRQNLFTVLPGHHWRAHEKLTQELAVLAKIPKVSLYLSCDATCQRRRLPQASKAEDLPSAEDAPGGVGCPGHGRQGSAARVDRLQAQQHGEPTAAVNASYLTSFPGPFLPLRPSLKPFLFSRLRFLRPAH